MSVNRAWMRFTGRRTTTGFTVHGQTVTLPGSVDDAYYIVSEAFRGVSDARKLTVHVGDLVRMNRAIDTREIDEIVRVATKGRYTSFIG